ncbi:MAG: porin [Defluviicoccus sp.]
MLLRRARVGKGVMDEMSGLPRNRARASLGNSAKEMVRVSMNKLLYGTTALATAGILLAAAGEAKAADRLALEVHGYMQQWMVFNDIGLTNVEDGTGKHPFDWSRVDQKHNAEVCFTGSYKLDNQVTIGADVQLEANTSGDQIDESYAWISTESFGKVIVGDENNAGYLLQVTAPHGGLAHNQGVITAMPNQGFVIAPQGFDIADTVIDGTLLRFDDDDSGKFTYISPRFAGFQIGVSYIPNFESGGDNNNSVNRVNSVTGPGTNGTINGFAGGINYKEKIGTVGVEASLAGLYGNTAPAAGSNDLFAGSVGLLLSFSGFEVGGSYTHAQGDKSTGPVANIESYDGNSYDVGVAYTTGPYKVGLAYQRGVSEGVRDNSGEQRADYLVLSGTYTLGPGVRVIGGVYAADLDGEDGVAAANQVEEFSAIGGGVGLTLSF